MMFKYYSIDKSLITEPVKGVQINIGSSEYTDRFLGIDEFEKFKEKYLIYINNNIKNEIVTTDKFNHYQYVKDFSTLYLDIDLFCEKDKYNKYMYEIYMKNWFEQLESLNYKFDYYLFIPETIIENKYGAHILIFLDRILNLNERKNIYNNIINYLDASNKINKILGERKIRDVFDSSPIFSGCTLLPFATKLNAKRNYKLIKYENNNNYLGMLRDIDNIKQITKSEYKSNSLLEKIYNNLDPNIWKYGNKEIWKVFKKLYSKDINNIQIFYNKYLQENHNTPTSLSDFQKFASNIKGYSFILLQNNILELTLENKKLNQYELLSELNRRIYKHVFEKRVYTYNKYATEYSFGRLSNTEKYCNLSLFIAKDINNNYIIHKDSENDIVITLSSLKPYFTLRNCYIPKIIKNKNGETETIYKSVNILSYFLRITSDYIPTYLGLKIFGNFDIEEEELKYIPKHYFIEPRDYEIELKNVLLWHDQFKQTFKNIDDYYMLMKRENYRINNKEAPSQCSFAWYSKDGGCGKGLGIEMISKLHYNTMPNLSEKSFQKEQLKSIVSKSYISIDEGGKQVNDDMIFKGINAIKSLFNTEISTREMCGNDEVIEIACDFDYCSNDYMLHGLFSSPEMRRRIIPSERVIPEKWDTYFLFESLKNKNFNRANRKYISENPEFSGYKYDDVKKYNKINQYAVNLIKLSYIQSNDNILVRKDKDINLIENLNIIYYNNKICFAIEKYLLINLLKDVLQKEKISLDKYLVNHQSEFKSMRSEKRTRSKSEKFQIININTIDLEFSHSASWSKYFIILEPRNIISLDLNNNIELNLYEKILKIFNLKNMTHDDLHPLIEFY